MEYFKLKMRFSAFNFFPWYQLQYYRKGHRLEQESLDLNLVLRGPGTRTLDRLVPQFLHLKNVNDITYLTVMPSAWSKWVAKHWKQFIHYKILYSIYYVFSLLLFFLMENEQNLYVWLHSSRQDRLEVLPPPLVSSVWPSVSHFVPVSPLPYLHGVIMAATFQDVLGSCTLRPVPCLALNIWFL